MTRLALSQNTQNRFDWCRFLTRARTLESPPSHFKTSGNGNPGLWNYLIHSFTVAPHHCLTLVCEMSQLEASEPIMSFVRQSRTVFSCQPIENFETPKNVLRFSLLFPVRSLAAHVTGISGHWCLTDIRFFSVGIHSISVPRKILRVYHS